MKRLSLEQERSATLETTEGHRMNRWPGKKILLLICAGLCIVVITGYLVVTVWLTGPRERFDFMADHGEIGHGMSGIGRLSEYRIYTWRQDFKALKADAASELKRAGFVVKEFNNIVEWKDSSGLVVDICNEHARPCRSSLIDSGWVTVIMSRFPPDNIMTHIKYALSSCSE